jgi:alkanesulfonate monooxygenase SsuD/methylene tetrahydromethanopterin reductase-like flavin-dependent oxidoreductase (luciferase family)
LWTRPLVKFAGRWHYIPDAGINPLPIQQPIPIWFGGHAEPVLRRIARLGDGWIPNYRSAEEARSSLDLLESYLRQAGRTRADIGIEPRIRFAEGAPHTWEQLFAGWQDAGVSHISFNTMQAGFDTPSQHIDALKVFASTMELANR